MTATCSWDSSIHSCQTLNKPSAGTDLIYGIVRITVRLLHPFAVDLILRKRICMNIYKKPSFTERLMRKIVGAGTFVGTGIHYDVVAHIPKSSLDMEDRSSLAMMAARHVPSTENDPLSHSSDISQPTRTQSTYIEAYTKSIQAVEWMLKLDRLRQESAMCNTLSR
jgi:kinesin family protein 13